MTPLRRALIWIAAYIPLGPLTVLILSLALRGWSRRQTLGGAGRHIAPVNAGL